MNLLQRVIARISGLDRIHDENVAFLHREIDLLETYIQQLRSSIPGHEDEAADDVSANVKSSPAFTSHKPAPMDDRFRDGVIPTGHAPKRKAKSTPAKKAAKPAAKKKPAKR